MNKIWQSTPIVDCFACFTDRFGHCRWAAAKHADFAYLELLLLFYLKLNQIEFKCKFNFNLHMNVDFVQISRMQSYPVYRND